MENWHLRYSTKVRKHEINESLITRTIENRDSTNYNMTAGNSNYQGND